MMIDPSIAAGVKPIQLNNPLEQYGQALQYQGMQQTNAFNRLKMDEIERERNALAAKNRAYSNALGPDGKLDPTKLKTNLAAENLGALIPDADKAYADAQKAGMDYQKAFGETVDTRFKTFRTLLDGLDPTNPESQKQALEWNDSLFQDDVLVQFFTQAGITREQGAAEIQAAIDSGTFGKWLDEERKGAAQAHQDALAQLNYQLDEKKFGLDKEKFGLEKTSLTYTPVNSGGKVELTANPKYRGQGKTEVVLSRDVTPDPNAKGTTINVNTAENSLLKKGSELAAEGNKTMFDGAQKAPEMIERSRMIRQLVNDPNTFVGPLAEVKLKAARSLGVFAKGQEQAIGNTELLMSTLAKGVFQQIHELGIGARGMDTPKEREYLENMTLGKIPFSKEAMTRLAELQEKYARKGYAIAKAKRDRLAKELSPAQLELLNYTLPDLPPAEEPSAAPAAKKPGTPVVTGSNGKSVPPAHVEYLKANPNTRADFEKKYGKAAADKALGR